MGLGDFFKKTFGKQACAFCGNEVGMLKRTKIKNKEFICTDCSYGCSRHIQLYRFTREELLGHMDYMKRQDRLCKEVLGNPSCSVPSAGTEQAVEFYDDFGMFCIRDMDKDRRYIKEPIRYDQVAKYEPYCDESEPDEPGKEKVFGECGVIITLVGAQDDAGELPKGVRPHPYITEELKVCLNDRDKHIGMMDVQHVIGHFNYIFGVGDDTKGLFSFGPTKQQRREGEAFKAMTGMFGAAIKAARTGEVPEDAKAQVEEAMSKVDDAATSGLAKYTRLADAAEEKVYGED
ncbi:MAG: hypothetical protein E7459_09610 [Ruminococcaceae bacterium]|nr:hypothetical protein [Oscillospiraceae bacterium]